MSATGRAQARTPKQAAPKDALCDALVSGDGDLQAVRDQFHVAILTIAEFADWLQAH